MNGIVFASIEPMITICILEFFGHSLTKSTYQLHMRVYIYGHFRIVKAVNVRCESAGKYIIVLIWKTHGALRWRAFTSPSFDCCRVRFAQRNLSGVVRQPGDHYKFGDFHLNETFSHWWYWWTKGWQLSYCGLTSIAIK